MLSDEFRKEKALLHEREGRYTFTQHYIYNSIILTVRIDTSTFYKVIAFFSFWLQMNKVSLPFQRCKSMHQASQVPLTVYRLIFVPFQNILHRLCNRGCCLFHRPALRLRQRKDNTINLRVGKHIVTISIKQSGNSFVPCLISVSLMRPCRSHIWWRTMYPALSSSRSAPPMASTPSVWCRMPSPVRSKSNCFGMENPARSS